MSLPLRSDLRRWIAYLRAASVDARLWLAGKQERDLPPLRLRDIGVGDFRAIGRDICRMLVDDGGLSPTDSVLDIGCGVGRVALPLTNFLAKTATYDGFDLSAGAIRWCRAHITPRFPNFRFKHANVKSSLYRLTGTAAEEFIFPYPDASFHFAFATSLFTHLTSVEMRQYVTQTRRVLRPGGRFLGTFFLLDEHGDLQALPFPYNFPVVKGATRLADAANPAYAVAVQEKAIRDLLREAGFSSIKVLPGLWTGRPGGTTFQDVIVAY